MLADVTRNSYVAQEPRTSEGGFSWDNFPLLFGKQDQQQCPSAGVSPPARSPDHEKAELFVVKQELQRAIDRLAKENESLEAGDMMKSTTRRGKDLAGDNNLILLCLLMDGVGFHYGVALAAVWVIWWWISRWPCLLVVLAVLMVL